MTHSLLFIVLVSVGAAWGLRRLHPETSLHQWGGLVAAVLLTHVGLDCLTTYGTQVFWPFSRVPVIYGTIFIIDPLYTIPLVIGLLTSLRWDKDTQARRWANYAGLAVSSAYLLLTVINKQHVNHVFRESLRRTVPEYERIFTAPTPFNNLLWQGIAESENGYYVGLYSLLDPDRIIDFRYLPKRHDLLGEASDDPVVRQLRRFSRGYFTVRRKNETTLLLHDLRFGRNDLGLTSDGTYLFTYRLQMDSDGHVVDMHRQEPSVRLDEPLLRRFLARIRGHSPSKPTGTDAISQ